MATPTSNDTVTEEQETFTNMLTAIREGQEAMDHAVRSWAEVAKTLMPGPISTFLLGARAYVRQLPALEGAIKGSFDSAEMLLRAQREFCLVLLRAGVPEPGTQESRDQRVGAADVKTETDKGGTAAAKRGAGAPGER